MVVADDGLLGVEDLAHFQGHLGLFEGAGQILNAVDHRADAHGTVSVKLAGEGVHNGAGQLVDVFLIDVGLDLLDQGDVRLVDIDDEVLVLIGEQVLEHIVGGDVVLLGNLHQHAHPADVRIEMELVALEIDVTGQDVIQDDVFDKVAPVVLLVVILLDAVQRDRKQADVFRRLGIIAGDEHRVFRTRTAAEGFIRIVAGDLKLYSSVWNTSTEAISSGVISSQTSPIFPSSLQAMITEDSSTTPMVRSMVSRIWWMIP